jgi:threonine/homoserine/homoserine lactone efflux protein
MVRSLLLGLGFGFACVVQPGPMQAYFLSRVAQVGWRRTLPASLAPLVSDGFIALAVLSVLRHVSEGMQRGLQGAGGVALLALAILTLRGTRAATDCTGQEKPGAAPRSLAQAVLVNVLNPGPYLGWSLVLGPEVLRRWPGEPAAAIAVVAAFYATLTLGNALTIAAIGGLHGLAPGRMRALLPISAAVLAILGASNLVGSLR